MAEKVKVKSITIKKEGMKDNKAWKITEVTLEDGRKGDSFQEFKEGEECEIEVKPNSNPQYNPTFVKITEKQPTTTTNEVSVTSREFYLPLQVSWVEQSGLSEADFNREVSFAIQHIQKNPYLKECTRDSVLRSVINLAQIGLTLNPVSKYAHLIPRYNGKTKQLECVLDPDYRGLVKLLTDTGVIKSMEARIVYSGDDFNFDYSSPDKVKKHTPFFLLNKEKGKTVCVYSLAILNDGSRHVEVMSYEDIMDIRERSESFKSYKDKKIKSCIWVSDEDEMCRKTVIRRHEKYLPKSNGMEKFQRAVELDNEHHGFEEQADYGIVSLVESMIWQSSMDEGKKESMRKRMLSIETKSEAFKMIDELKDSQPIVGVDRIPVHQYEISTAAKNAADRDDFKEQIRNKR